MTKPIRLAVFLSGSGSNAEKIFLYFNNHATIEVACVLSNNPQAVGLQRAEKFGLPARVFSKTQLRESDEVISWLKEAGVTHVVLAGFLWMIPPNLVRAYRQRIINIHPALLPKFGGKGMYGSKVHEAVKAASERETGITIHEVNEQYDEGRILFQGKCPIHPKFSVEQIAEQVQRLEHAHYPRVIEQWVNETK
ncbi:MAG: phosphoribosylglycinamide formyltransferase [Flammeovirgaceae bacterium]|nr:phosphoribosylglycinamide formyltransferase [Flammeovirgaceae bacterium]